MWVYKGLMLHVGSVMFLTGLSVAFRSYPIKFSVLDPPLSTLCAYHKYDKNLKAKQIFKECIFHVRHLE